MSIQLRCLLTIFALIPLASCVTPSTQASNELAQTRIQTPTFDETHFIAQDGYKLPFKSWPAAEEPERIILALHGFNDYSNAFSGLCEFMTDKHSTKTLCMAYDQRGFGATEQTGIWPQKGKLQSDLMTMSKSLKLQYPNAELYLVGESMGGAVIISALTQNNDKTSHIDGIILLAPAVWAQSTQPWYQRFALFVAVHTFPGWKPTGESLGVVATDNGEALIAMSQDPLVIKETRIDAIYGLTNLMDLALENASAIQTPALVLYGLKDEVIPKTPTCEMLKRMESQVNHQLKLYTNGYHMLSRDLQAPRVFKDMTAWMDDQNGFESSSIEELYCEQ